MTDTTYNGWTNYATWRVNLELCSDKLDNLESNRERFESVSDLADRLKQMVDDVITNYGENEEGIAVDYASAFVSDVNWYEIAEHYPAELIGENDEPETNEEE